MSTVDPARLDRARFGRFIAVGIASAATDIGLLQFSHAVMGLSVPVAAGLGFWGSFVLNFLLHKYYSFQARAHTHRQLIRYSILVAFNFAATVGIVTAAEAIGIGYLAGKFIALGVLTLMTYALYTRWVFGPTDTKAPTDLKG